MVEVDYEAQQKYWNAVYKKDPNIKGAMGGFESYSDADLKYSHQFLAKCNKFISGSSKCLEVGAGVGRVTRDLLSFFYEKIDLNDLSNQVETSWD